MLSHVFIGVNQFESALAFYQPLMAALGLDLKFRDHQHPWAGWKHPEHERPLFVIGRPFDGEPAAPGNGQMFALLACVRTTTPSTTAAIFAIPKATSCAWCATTTAEGWRLLRKHLDMAFDQGQQRRVQAWPQPLVGLLAGGEPRVLADAQYRVRLLLP